MPASTRNSHVPENKIQLTLSTTSPKSKPKLTGKTKQNSTSARNGITLPFTGIVLHGANTAPLSTFRRSINGATQIESASKIFTPQATAWLPSQPSRQQQRLASAGYYHFDQLGERRKTSVHILLTKQFHKMNEIEPATLKIQPAPNLSLQPDFKAASLKTKIVTSPKTKLLALIWS